MKIGKIALSLLLASLLLPFTAQAGNTIVKAKLDSVTLLMGKTTTLHLEIDQDKNVKGYFLNEQLDTLTSKVEVAGRPKADTVDLGNNRIQINKDLIIQSFDSGLYVLPPMQYVVGSDTFKTERLSLKVIPVKVDRLKDIHDYKPVEKVPFKFFDIIPSFITDYWWIYLIIILLVLGGLYTYFKWFKKGVNPLKPKKKRLPPYEEAIQALNDLKAQNLWQNGQEKEYFTALTDILRVYIDRRFSINAVEMTSTQIIDTLKQNNETKAVNEQLSEILEVADFVKFANMHTLADDNELALRRSLNFVEDTKPVPVSVEGEAEAGVNDNENEEEKK